MSKSKLYRMIALIRFGNLVHSNLGPLVAIVTANFHRIQLLLEPLGGVFKVAKPAVISLLAFAMKGEAMESARDAVVWMIDLGLTKRFRSAFIALQRFTIIVLGD